MTDNTEKNNGFVDGSAWHAFCDGLKAVGDQVLRPEVPGDEATRAEGYRYLTRLLRLGLENNVEFNNPRFPAFYSLSHETAKIGNDNPDNFYQNCNISGQYEYRIWGNRGTVPYLSIETKAGQFGTTGDMAPTGHVEIDQLECDADGNFELWLSCDEKAGNWLPMTPQTDNLLVRQTFHDRKAERKAELHIECLNADGDNYLRADEFAAQLGATTQFMQGTAGLFIDWMQTFSAHINQLPSNDQSMCLRAGGDPSIHYMNSYWQLAEDEVLLIHAAKIPQCRTWNFQLSNFWMESLDYRYYPISVNKHSAHYNNDGSVTIAVAHDDVSELLPNALRTTGHRLGGMLFRWVEATEYPPVQTRVVKRDELAQNLPFRAI